MSRALSSLIFALLLLFPEVAALAAQSSATPIPTSQGCRGDRVVVNQAPNWDVAVYDIDRGEFDVVSPMWLRSGIQSFPTGVAGRAMILNANRDFATIDLASSENTMLYGFPGPVYSIGNVPLVEVPVDSPWVAVASQGETVIEIDLISLVDNSIFETKSVVGEGVTVTGVTVAPGSKSMVVSTLEKTLLGTPGDASSFQFDLESPGAMPPRYSPDGRLLVSEQGSYATPSLLIIDAETTETVTILTLDSGADWEFLDATRLVVADDEGISVIDITTNDTTSYLIDSESPWISQISKDGRKLLFDRSAGVQFDASSNTLIDLPPDWGVLDLETGDVSTPLEIQGRSLLGQDQSNWWVFGGVLSTATPSSNSTAPSLVIFDIERGSVASVLEGESGDTIELIDLSMDGRFLVGSVGHPGDYRVELVDLQTDVVNVLLRADSPQRALISPDSCHVAVGTDDPGSEGPYGVPTTIFKIDGTEVVQLETSKFVGWAPGLG